MPLSKEEKDAIYQEGQDRLRKLGGIYNRRGLDLETVIEQRKDSLGRNTLSAKDEQSIRDGYADENEDI